MPSAISGILVCFESLALKILAQMDRLLNSLFLFDNLLVIDCHPAETYEKNVYREIPEISSNFLKDLSAKQLSWWPISPNVPKIYSTYFMPSTYISGLVVVVVVVVLYPAIHPRSSGWLRGYLPLLCILTTTL